MFARRSVTLSLSSLMFAAIGALIVSPASAERPTAPRLLPADTLAYIRVADMPELVKRFQETSLGRISQDEQVRPLLDHLWGSLVEATQQLEDQLGASLQDLLAIPQGETCVALVAPETGRPALVLLFDAGPRMPIVQKLLDRAEAAMAEQGATETLENIEGTELIVYRLPGERQREMAYLQRDGTLIAGTSADIVRGMVDAWDGRPASKLADNTDFTAIMKRCTGDEGETPQVTFFVDALELTKRVARGNLAGQTLIALLPALGLDGVQGLGGSIAFATEQYDSVAHVHLLLDSPRKGIPAMLALRGGELTPEPWAPADAVTYTSFNWDVPASYAAFETLYDAIRGEGALNRDVKQGLSAPLGIDFEKEFLDALDGRVTHVSWMVKPARLNSRSNLVGMKLKDPKTFRKTWLKVTDKLQQQLERKAIGSTEYWQLRLPEPPSGQPDRPLLRRPEPAFAIVGDYFLLTDSSEFLKHAVVTKGNAAASLAGELDFKLIASKIRRQNSGENPGLLSFNRPEESMRLLYELATSETTRQRLQSQAENNRFFGALDGALRDNPLPPFAVIARYLAPGGSLVTNDATGFHYTAFTLRRR